MKERSILTLTPDCFRASLQKSDHPQNSGSVRAPQRKRKSQFCRNRLQPLEVKVCRKRGAILRPRRVPGIQDVRRCRP
jgi:hypothetical protein